MTVIDDVVHGPASVWAPKPGRVELLIGGDRILLEEHDGGWRAVPQADREKVRARLAAGERYGFVLDGEDRPLPDPRSLRQPDGVHELSAGFDPAAHEWTDDAWTGRELPGAVVYELHIGTFTSEGTLDSAASRLPYLADLGIDFVELLPVNAFNGPHNWGYDGVLWHAVHEQYGGPAAYQRFVDAAHAHGIGVIQDVVYNHLGPSGNYLPRFGPYLLEGGGTDWGDSVNLDGPGSDEVRDFILENARLWLADYHVDGLRLDAVHAFVDRRAVPLLEELATVSRDIEQATGRSKFLVAESDLNDPRIISPQERGGDGIHAQWSDDYHHAVHAALTGEADGYYEDFADPDALPKVLRAGFYHDGTYSSFRGRRHGRPLDPEVIRPTQLVVCSQNHDQVGNRATGDRPSATLGYDGLAVAAVLVLASPFTPMLFMGEEYGARTPWQFFTSHPEPELAKATAEGRLREFERMGWDPSLVPDPQDPETRLRSILDWSEAETDDGARLLSLYRRLIAVRREHPSLWSAPLDQTDVMTGGDRDARWIAWSRPGVSVAVNLGSGPLEFELPPASRRRVAVSTHEAIRTEGGRLAFPGRGAVVLVD